MFVSPFCFLRLQQAKVITRTIAHMITIITTKSEIITISFSVKDRGSRFGSDDVVRGALLGMVVNTNWWMVGEGEGAFVVGENSVDDSSVGCTVAVVGAAVGDAPRKAPTGIGVVCLAHTSSRSHFDPLHDAASAHPITPLAVSASLPLRQLVLSP